MSTPTIERRYATVRLVHGTTLTVLNAERLTTAIRILNDLYDNWTGLNTAMDSMTAAYPLMAEAEAADYLRAAQKCIDHNLTP